MVDMKIDQFKDFSQKIFLLLKTADLFMSVIMYRLKKNGRAAVVVPDGIFVLEQIKKVNIKRKLLTKFNLHTIIRLPNSVFAPYTSITTNLLIF